MSDITFTKAQQAALRPGGKLVLAGAGSGKTTVLTEKYLRLLDEEGLAPKEIVAMTYTRKAATNLQAKIHKALRVHQQQEPARASLWREHREQMPWARISTIHGFCTSLLRLFPYEAGVDPEFIVRSADPVRDERISRRVRDLAYARDTDLAWMLGVLESRERIESLVRLLVDSPEVASAVNLAAEDPARAVSWLDSTLATIADRFADGEPSDAASPGVTGHPAFVEALPRLWRLAEPLLTRNSGPRTVLTYDDLELLALRLLETNGSAARRVRASIRFLLVDEFQDTSTRQWRLIRNLVTQGDGNPDPQRLFLVGDAKQSIYGFRDADVTVVNRARRLFGSALGEEDRWEVDLADNFRTLPGPLKAMNSAFDRLLAPRRDKLMDFEAPPGRLRSERKNNAGAEPLVELSLGWGLSPEEIFRALARRLRAEIGKTLIEDPDKGQLRALRAEDIGILLRYKRQMGPLERIFEEEGVRCSISGGRGFLARQEVVDLIHLLVALSDPRDHVALTGVLRSPLLGMDDVMVAALFLDGDDPLEVLRRAAAGESAGDSAVATLDQRRRKELGKCWKLWEKLTTLANHESPTMLLLAALEARGAWAPYGVGRDGERRVANIYRLLDLVRELTEEGHYTLRRLVKRIQSVRELPEEEQDREAEVGVEPGVRVMTIHSAKGLEFPYVILTDMLRSYKKSSMSSLRRGNLLAPEGVWSALASPGLGLLADAVAPENTPLLHRQMKEVFGPAEEQAEELRLMYVAATRARDRLLLISEIPVKEKKKEGLVLNIHPTSSLQQWLDALDVRVTANGSEKLAPREGFSLTVVEKPDQSSGESSKHHQDVRILQTALYKHPVSDHWVLPFTAFSSLAANPDDDESIRRLVWFGDVEDPVSRGDAAVAPEAGPSSPSPLAIGSLIHAVYQKLGPGVGPDDAWGLVEQEVDRWGLKSEQREATLMRVRQLLVGGHSLGLQSIPEGAKRELPVRLMLDSMVLRGSVDLAWRDGDEIVVVDYKTNHLENEEDVSAAIQRHGYDHQVRLYGLTLLKAWGAKRAVGRLVFLDGGRQREFEVTLSDEAGYSEVARSIRRRWRELTNGTDS